MFFLPLQLATGKLNPEKSNQSIDARLTKNYWDIPTKAICSYRLGPLGIPTYISLLGGKIPGFFQP